MTHTYEDLKKNRAGLREIAAGIEHEQVHPRDRSPL